MLEGLPLVKAGYTVFSVEHRALPTFHYPAPVQDVQRAVRLVRHNAKRFGIDPDRIGAMGGSSGGHLVSMLAVLDGKGDPTDGSPVNQESARVQCVVARAAPSNLLAKRKDSGFTSMFLGALISPWTRPGTISYKLATEASPVTHVSADDPPILLLHGDADKMVPVELSREFAKVLATAGVTHELVEVEGAGHFPSYPGAKDPTVPVKAMVRWFATHLQAK
jgi:acetyl esterase/lipase